MQDVASAQSSASVSAEKSECEGAFAAEVIRYIETMADGEIGAHAGFGDGTDAQGLTTLHPKCSPEGNGFVIEHGGSGCPSQCNDSGSVEAQRRACECDLKRGSRGGIFDQAIR